MFFISLIRNSLNFIDHFQQKKIIKFFKKNSTNKIILFDVGSHYGETIKLFSKVFMFEQFHCFEASQINFDVLKKNIKNLNFKNKYYLNNIGLGYQVGKVLLIIQTKHPPLQ